MFAVECVLWKCKYGVESTKKGCLHQCCSDVRWSGMFDEVRYVLSIAAKLDLTVDELFLKTFGKVKYLLKNFFSCCRDEITSKCSVGY
jgi:hypothetical protein